MIYANIRGLRSKINLIKETIQLTNCYIIAFAEASFKQY